MIEIRKIIDKDEEEFNNLSIQLGYNSSIAETIERIRQIDKNPDNYGFVAVI